MATGYSAQVANYKGNYPNSFVTVCVTSYDTDSIKDGKATIKVDAYIYCSWNSVPYVAYRQDLKISVNGNDVYSYKNAENSPSLRVVPWFNSDWSKNSMTYNSKAYKQRAHLASITTTVDYGFNSAPTIPVSVYYNVLNGNKHDFPPASSMTAATTLTLPRQTRLTVGSATVSANRDTVGYSCSVTSWGTGASTGSYEWNFEPKTQVFEYLDYTTAYNYVHNGGTLTAAQKDLYDINRNGDVDADDLFYIYYDAAGIRETAASGTSEYFLPNTEYNWTLKVTNSLGSAVTKSGTFTTGGNYPTLITEPTATSTRTSISVSVSAKADYGDEIISYNFSYGTSPSAEDMMRGPSTGTANNLQPNTMYYYQIGVTSAKGKQSTYKTGQIKTLCNAPSNLAITRSSGGTNNLVIGVSGTGDTNAPIKNYVLQYTSPTGTTKKVEMGSATSTNITGLSVDTDYVFKLTATNDGGSTTSGNVTYSTTLVSPIVDSFVASNILPFSCTVTAKASITPERVLQYSFSKDGQNWTPYQSSGVYNWTGLSEETTYTMYVRAKAIHTGKNASDTTTTKSITVITPADQAKIRIYKNNSWKKGKLWFKVGGKWKKAKKVYIKKGGKWVVGYNYEN